MGMTAIFVPVDAGTLAEFRRDPQAAEDALDPDEDTEPGDDTFSVAKAYHGLHYLLTGTAYEGEPPLSWAIFGDAELGADLGVGGSSFLAPDQVRQVAAALAVITEPALRQRFDPQRMQALGIYPDVMWVRDGQDALDWVLTHFKPLVHFYAGVAERGQGLVLYTA
jgi:hypothetical protein